jgi:predicted dithiol-disulfide oxidoreductase (DUF899 family)
MMNVFHRDGQTIRHFWGSELFYAPSDPGQDPRHVGTIEPVWNLFDLTPRRPWNRLGRAAQLHVTASGSAVSVFPCFARDQPTAPA